MSFFQRYHLPEHECSKCGEAMSRIEVQKHALLCTGKSELPNHNCQIVSTSLSGLQRVNSVPVNDSKDSAPNPPLENSFASVATHPSSDQRREESPARLSFARVDDLVQGKPPESSTSPANVSDLLRSSSPEPQGETFMPENEGERSGHQSPTMGIKNEPRDLLEESMHINGSPLVPEGEKNILGESSVLEGRSEGERVTFKKEEDTTNDLRDSEEPVIVILMMRLEGYPVRKLRLKSTQGVIVAMKGFATASGFSYKELR